MRDDFSAGGRRGDENGPVPDEAERTLRADTVKTDAGARGAEAAPSADELQRQLEEQRDRYLRLAAEFDNFRKRTARERQEVVARGQAELMRQLLDPIDDLGRAVAVDADRADSASILHGVQAVNTKLHRALTNLGLEIVNPLDQPFNPELHEAIATERALSPEDDHLVAQVYQPGYVFQGQLLRPARVVVKQWAE